MEVERLKSGNRSRLTAIKGGSKNGRDAKKVPTSCIRAPRNFGDALERAEEVEEVVRQEGSAIWVVGGIGEAEEGLQIDAGSLLFGLLDGRVEEVEIYSKMDEEGSQTCPFNRFFRRKLALWSTELEGVLAVSTGRAVSRYSLWRIQHTLPGWWTSQRQITERHQRAFGKHPISKRITTQTNKSTASK